MKRFISALLAALMIVLGAQAALGETIEPAYEHPVLVFNAPKDAVMSDSVNTEDSYFQTLYVEDADAMIMSGAYPTLEEAQAKLTELFGDMAGAERNEGLDAVNGYYAEWTSFTIGETNSESSVDVVLIHADRTYLFASVVPQKVYLGYTDLGVYADVVSERIESLEIFDPYASLYLIHEDEADSFSYTLAGDVTVDAGAGAFLMYALDSITGVRLVTVDYDAEGVPALGETLGSWELLSFGQVVRVFANLPDTMPNLAVVYTDASGTENVRYIGDSAIDGTLMLIE